MRYAAAENVLIHTVDSLSLKLQHGLLPRLILANRLCDPSSDEDDSCHTDRVESHLRLHLATQVCLMFL